MKNRIKKVVALLMMLVVMGSSEAVLASETENPILPVKLIEIAEGSDEIYGEGVLLDHQENPNSRFVSGGVNHTHQYIVANALLILNNDFGSNILNSEANVKLLLEGTDWPDGFGNETDYGTFAGHFYNPVSGENWLGQKSPTAKTRGVDYFNWAVNAYKAGNVSVAFDYLGKGTHYVSDINEPHHAQNLTAVNSNHTAFEKYVDTNRSNYKIDNNTIENSYYESALAQDVDSLMHNAALNGWNLAAKAQKESTMEEAASQSVKNAIISVTQYLYKFGKTVELY